MELTLSSQCRTVPRPLFLPSTPSHRLPPSSSSAFLNPPNPISISLQLPRATPIFILTPKRTAGLRVSASQSTQTPTFTLTSSTRTLTTIAAAAFSLSRLFADSIIKFLGVSSIQAPQVQSVGPLFFAMMSAGPGSLDTPLTVLASGVSRWLEIYSAILMVRVLLSWFPNLPWDRQPMIAIRDLCDPFLNVFRGVIPPLFNTLDVSPLLAFAVLGMCTQILRKGSKL